MGTDLVFVDPKAQEVANIDYGDAAGQGFEGGKAKLPWLKLAQPLTPQVETVDGLKPGLIFNTVTNEFWKEIVFVPVLFTQGVLVWRPNRGGLVDKMDHDDKRFLDSVKELGGRFQRDEEGKVKKPKDDDGNDMVFTKSVFGLQVLESGDVMPAGIAFASTGLKVWEQWNSMGITKAFVDANTGRRVSRPPFAYAYKLGSKSETNALGKFHNFTVGFVNGSDSASLLSANSNVFQAAQALWQSLKNDFEAKVDYATSGTDANESGPGGSASGAKGTDKDVPF